MTEYINVLHLIQYGKLGGGVNKTLLTQLKGSDTKRIKYYAIVAEDGPVVEQFRPYFEDIIVIPIPHSILYQRREDVKFGIHNLLNLFGLLPFIISGTRYIYSNNIHLIHSHNLKTNFLGVLLSLFSRKPVVCHIRSATPLGFMGRIYEWGANKIVSVSKGAQTASFSKIRNTKKHAIIYNGRDLNEFTPLRSNEYEDLRMGFGLLPDQVVVGIVGSLIRWKDHICFLNAAKFVLEHYPNVQFLVVGDIDYEAPEYINELKQLVKQLNIEKNVIFTGFRQDVNRIYNIIDILVSCSWFEALGGVMIEAMACGLPVIGTDAGGTPEIISDNVTGLLVPARDAQSLSRAMLKLIENETMRHQMGAKGLARAQQKFSVQRYVNDIETFYMHLVKL